MIKNFIDKYFNLPEGLYKKNNRYLLIASFFGCGYFKKAPGTFTSAVALILGLIIGFISPNLLIIVTTLVILVGFFVSERVVSHHSKVDKDPSYIVIDEVAGMLLAMLLVSNNIILSIVAFAIFRILDIKKPWIIGMAETSFKGGSAVMMDDIVAGFITLLIVTLLLTII